MAKVYKLKNKQGEVVYPLTCIEAVSDNGQPLAYDQVPTSGSSNFVKSGGIFDEIVTNGAAFDVTKANNGATYSTLQNAINAIPAAYRRGGMRIRYVQTSDQKYVSFVNTNKDWSSNPSDWTSGGGGDGVFDISTYNAVGGTPATYSGLTQALGANGSNVPSDERSGGMSVKYIDSTSGQYEQWRYMASGTTNSEFVSVANWQGVDETPTAGSQNLVTSGGVKEETANAVKNNSSLYTCETAAATKEKTVSVPGYVLGSAGALRIKFTNENTFSANGSTAQSSTLNISSTGAKKLFYNGLPAAIGNSWEANGVVEIYYDADADNGSGAYYAYPISEKGCISLYKIGIKLDNNAGLVASEILGKYIYFQNTNKLMFAYAGMNNGLTNFVEVPLYVGMRFFYQGHDYYYDGTTLVRVDDSDEFSIGEGYFQIGIKISTNGTYSAAGTSGATPKIEINHANSVVNLVAKGAMIIGYESLDSTGILLGGLENPSSTVTYTLSKRVPANIKYVAFGYTSATGLTSCSITRDYSLENLTYDMDAKWPLESGYYTIATAIAAVPEVYRGLNKTLLYKTDASTSQKIVFIGTDVSNWTNEAYWNFVEENDNSVRGITAETNFKINPIVTNEDLTRDQYLEFVCTTKNRVASGQVYFACSKVFNMRYNAANLQVYYRGKLSQISTGAPSVADKDNYHHFLLVKSQKDESGTITHWFDVYIDGVNVSHVDVTDSISSTIPVASNTHFFCPYWNFLVLRAGYYSGDSDGVDAFASAHFNNGNPVAYRDNVNELIYEFLPENMRTDYLVNSANKIRSILDTSTQPVTLLYSSPYDDVLKGSGAPTVAPRYLNQEYIDTTNNNHYIASGNLSPSNWKLVVTQDMLDSMTITINDLSIWRPGVNIDTGSGGGGSSSNSVINVKDEGATGNGATDDTEYIMAAVEKARTRGLPLFFPNGTYLTKKSIILTSGMKITGEPNAIIQNGTIKNNSGYDYFTTVTAVTNAGGYTVTVADASKFEVGQEVVITKSPHASYSETMADITAINGNVLTIDTSRFTANGDNGGLLYATSATGCYVLSDFAMIKTIQTKAAENVIVENITIKPMSDMSEPHIYTSSPISQTKQGTTTQKNFRVYNITVYDSANDGISLQGSGESEVVGCRVYNQKHKGIHWGTTHDMIRIHGNYVYGCGSSAYDNPNDYYGSGGLFFCVNNSRVIITNNHIENCYRGIYGLNDGDAQDRDAVIANNTLTNCGLYGIYMHGGNRVVVNSNIFRNFAQGSIPICAEKGGTYNQIATVLSNNVISDFNANFDGPAAIEVNGAKHMSITGNLISKQSTAGTQGIVEKGTNTNIVVANGDGIIITGNMVDGNIDISAETNVNVIAANNIGNIINQQ